MAQPPEDQSDLATRVQRLEDIEAIKWMIVRYAQGADQHNNVDIMLPLFADDAVWDAGERFGRYEGKQAIYEFLKGSGSFIGWTLHYMVSPAIKNCGRRKYGPGVLVSVGDSEYAASANA